MDLTTTLAPAAETVKAFQQSQANRTESWKHLLADDVVFIAPDTEVAGKAENIKLNEAFIAMVKSHETLQMATNGNVVFLETIFVLTAPSGKEITLRMAEIYEVEGGEITNMKVYYDPAEFRKEILCANN